MLPLFSADWAKCACRILFAAAFASSASSKHSRGLGWCARTRYALYLHRIFALVIPNNCCTRQRQAFFGIYWLRCESNGSESDEPLSSALLLLVHPRGRRPSSRRPISPLTLPQLCRVSPLCHYADDPTAHVFKARACCSLAQTSPRSGGSSRRSPTPPTVLRRAAGAAVNVPRVAGGGAVTAAAEADDIALIAAARDGRLEERHGGDASAPTAPGVVVGATADHDHGTRRE